MKKLVLLLFIFMLCCSFFAFAEDEEAWKAAPVIKHAYEIGTGKVYLEWDGSAPVYQVFVDGEKVADVNVCNTVVPLKNGTHQIQVYPVYEIKAADTKLEINIQVIDIGLDLAALGLDPKDMMAGTPSDVFSVDYVASTMFDAVPDQPNAMTDFDNIVNISFVDRYHADEYIVSIKAGDDVNYVKFGYEDANSAAFIQRKGTAITIKLEPEYLEAQECIIPELDQEYEFSVQLRKNIEDYIVSEHSHTTVHASKESEKLKYTPTAAWKLGAEVFYASQTADGQVTLQWNHDDNGLGCEYAIMKIKKTFGIKTGEEEIGRTGDQVFVVNDLMNGKNAFTVVPVLQDKKGNASNEVEIDIQNEWVVAPVLLCEDMTGGVVRLVWTATEGVEEYHVVVYKGDNDSLLRYVNLDFSQYTEEILPAVTGEMEYRFTFDGDINPDLGERLKFEVYGLRHAANGDEQKSSASTQIIIIY